jgi:group I intron endonuclease
VASGIYKILCLSDGKSYIGSAKNLSKRWWTHRRALNRKQHGNIHLQHAWDKYGASNFEFSVVEQVEDLNYLVITEQHWLDATDNLFNICPIAGSSLGRVASTETRQKMSLARQGKIHDEETCKKIGEANRRRLITDETKRKQAEAKLGNTYCQGRVLSESTKAKIRASKQGKKLGPRREAI